jgi:hypothetical protein
MKNKFILWGAVAVGAYLIYKRMSKKDSGKEIAPPPVGNTRPPLSKPPISYIKPMTTSTISNQVI